MTHFLSGSQNYKASHITSSHISHLSATGLYEKGFFCVILDRNRKRTGTKCHSFSFPPWAREEPLCFSVTARGQECVKGLFLTAAIYLIQLPARIARDQHSPLWNSSGHVPVHSVPLHQDFWVYFTCVHLPSCTLVFLTLTHTHTLYQTLEPHLCPHAHIHSLHTQGFWG